MAQHLRCVDVVRANVQRLQGAVTHSSLPTVCPQCIAHPKQALNAGIYIADIQDSQRCVHPVMQGKWNSLWLSKKTG